MNKENEKWYQIKWLNTENEQTKQTNNQFINGRMEKRDNERMNV